MEICIWWSGWKAYVHMHLVERLKSDVNVPECKVYDSHIDTPYTQCTCAQTGTSGTTVRRDSR